MFKRGGDVDRIMKVSWQWVAHGGTGNREGSTTVRTRSEERWRLTRTIDKPTHFAVNLPEKDSDFVQLLCSCLVRNSEHHESTVYSRLCLFTLLNAMTRHEGDNTILSLVAVDEQGVGHCRVDVITCHAHIYFALKIMFSIGHRVHQHRSDPVVTRLRRHIYKIMLIQACSVHVVLTWDLHHHPPADNTSQWRNIQTVA